MSKGMHHDKSVKKARLSIKEKQEKKKAKKAAKRSGV